MPPEVVFVDPSCFTPSSNPDFSACTLIGNGGYTVVESSKVCNAVAENLMIAIVIPGWSVIGGNPAGEWWTWELFSALGTSLKNGVGTEFFGWANVGDVANSNGLYTMEIKHWSGGVTAEEELICEWSFVFSRDCSGGSGGECNELVIAAVSTNNATGGLSNGAVVSVLNVPIGWTYQLRIFDNATGQQAYGGATQVNNSGSIVIIAPVLSLLPGTYNVSLSAGPSYALLDQCAAESNGHVIINVE